MKTHPNDIACLNCHCVIGIAHIPHTKVRQTPTGMQVGVLQFYPCPLCGTIIPVPEIDTDVN